MGCVYDVSSNSLGVWFCPELAKLDDIWLIYYRTRHNVYLVINGWNTKHIFNAFTVTGAGVIWQLTVWRKRSRHMPYRYVKSVHGDWGVNLCDKPTPKFSLPVWGRGPCLPNAAAPLAVIPAGKSAVVKLLSRKFMTVWCIWVAVVGLINYVT